MSSPFLRQYYIVYLSKCKASRGGYKTWAESFIFSSTFCPRVGFLKERFLWKSTENKKQEVLLFLTVIRLVFDVECISALACREQNFCLIEKSSQEHKITLCLKLTTLSTTSGRAVLQKYRLMERIDRTKRSGMERWLFVRPVFGAQRNSEGRGPDENKNRQTLVVQNSLY